MESAVTRALSLPAVQSILRELCVQDTVHDFWDGGRGEANPISDDDLRDFRQKIDAFSKQAVGLDITTVTLNEIKTRGLGNWINKPSDYERSLIKIYEDKLSSHLFSKTKETITYRQILEDSQIPGEPLKTRYLNNRGFCNIVSIIPNPNEYFDSFTQKEKNIIANFILTFMFAKPGDTNVGSKQYGITYDAGPVAPRKVFADIEQMYNYIYPQNITDSAATSFKSKKINFVFPNDSIIRSNLFTSSDVQIAFVNRGYNALNRYAFNWEFKTKQGTTATLPFGPGQSDGPSVNYLVTSFLNGPVNGVREKSTIVDISRLQPIFNQNRGIIFDLKRSGDFEQVHASLNDGNVIFATIDHLCSFYARLLHKPCIWSNNASSEIVMYRFDVGEVKPEDDFKRQNIFFAQEQLKRLELLPESKKISEDVTKAKAEFQRGMSSYYFTLSKSQSSDKWFAFVNNPAGYNASSVDTQGYLADALTTAFFRLKCKDTYDLLVELEKAIVGFQPRWTPGQYREFTELMRVLIERPDDFQVTPNGEGFSLSYKGKQNVERVIESVKAEIETLKPVLDIQLTNQPFYIQLITPNNTYNHKANNPLFDFSSGHFKSIHAAFRAMIGIIFSGRAGRDRDKKAFGFLTEYFEARETLLGTFRNKELAEQARQASDILVSDLTVSEAALPALGERAIEMVRKMYTPTRMPLGGIPQQGGYTPPEAIGQVTDLEQLFRDICGKAAAYVESVISENLISAGVQPADDADKNVTQADMVRVLSNDATLQITRDIAVHWETELMRIRENAPDNYGHNYVLTPTDVFVSMLLSTYSGPSGTIMQSYLMDTPIDRRDMPRYQDYYGALITVPYSPEIRNLIVLTIFDNMLTQKSAKYLKKLTPLAQTKYSAPAEWEKLAQHLQMVITSVNSYSMSRELKSLFKGGRRPLYSTTP